MIKVKSKELKSAIISSGYSLSKFAKMCGRSKSSINNILKRESVSAAFANKICCLLQEDFNKFFLIS